MKKNIKKTSKGVRSSDKSCLNSHNIAVITNYTTSCPPSNGDKEPESPHKELDNKTGSGYDPWQKIDKPKRKLSSPITLKTRLSSRKPSAKEGSRELTQTSLHTHYNFRRSKRMVEASQKKLELDMVVERLEDGDGDGLEIRTLPEKGRAVFTTQNFYRGEFVCEYAGELISYAKAKDRELEYSEDILKGCYMYYFKHEGVGHCLDATEETGRLGRLINHSRIKNNIKPRVIEDGHKIYLCFFATRDIDIGEELLYDYGDRSRESIKNFPWLKT